MKSKLSVPSNSKQANLKKMKNRKSLYPLFLKFLPFSEIQPLQSAEKNNTFCDN